MYVECLVQTLHTLLQIPTYIVQIVSRGGARGRGAGYRSHRYHPALGQEEVRTLSQSLLCSDVVVCKGFVAENKILPETLDLSSL